MDKRDVSVDIIIPIYNAYEDLEICLESVYRNTDLEKNRLILVNDNSPDERIKEFLDKQTRHNVIVIHNETNKGFSANINTGISQSEKNDVLFLNSDTVVTANWIEKIVECAYSDPAIGTVTPLSNNASLCSVPVFCEENKLPAGMTVGQAGKIVERCSFNKYPRITVAHGFCMFVKREVINIIGDFDAATFGRGYGEENDFCNRAEQMGYRHVMCDNTFILHTGTKSFVSAEKQAYIDAHDKILRERYPLQMHGNDVHVRDNPNGCVSENVGIYFDLNNGKKNILYVLQSDFRPGAEDNVGGTQLHVKHLTMELRKNNNIFVAARDGEYLNISFYSEDASKDKLWRFHVGARPAYYEFSNAKFRRIWANILVAFKIDVVHVHHVISTSFDIFYEASRLNIPIVYTLHDYFMVSPSEKLLDDRYNIINSANETEGCWDKLLRDKYCIYDGVAYIKLWRSKCLEIMELCAQIIVPDDSVRNIVCGYYPQLEAKINVVAHGYNYIPKTTSSGLVKGNVEYKIEKVTSTGGLTKLKGWAYVEGLDYRKSQKVCIQISNGTETEIIPAGQHIRTDVIAKAGRRDAGFEAVIPPGDKWNGSLVIRPVIETTDGQYIASKRYQLTNNPKIASDRVNIAFIGGINKEKGGEEILKIVKNSKDGANWYLFGGVGLAELENLKQCNYVNYGQYLSDDLPRLLDLFKIDVICILSIWPETFSYTLTESLLCKRPAIVTNIGALGHRMESMDCGWSVDVKNAAQEVIDIVEHIEQDRGLIIAKRDNIADVKLQSIEGMCSIYQKIYDQYGVKLQSEADFEPDFIYRAYAYRSHVLEGESNNMSDDEVALYRDEYNKLTSTVTYRICMKIQNFNFPGKETLYKLLKGRM